MCVTGERKIHRFTGDAITLASFTLTGRWSLAQQAVTRVVSERKWPCSGCSTVPRASVLQRQLALTEQVLVRATAKLHRVAMCGGHGKTKQNYVLNIHVPYTHTTSLQGGTPVGRMAAVPAEIDAPKRSSHSPPHAFSTLATCAVHSAPNSQHSSHHDHVSLSSPMKYLGSARIAPPVRRSSHRHTGQLRLTSGSSCFSARS